MDLQTPQEFSHGASGVRLETQATMIVQIIILGMLVIALIEWRRRRLSSHGMIMGMATAISLTSFALVMLPIFNDSLSDFLNDVQAGSVRAQVNLEHALSGAIAIGLSAFVTGKWVWNRFRLGKGCYQRNLMRATVGAWLVALFFGTLVYLAHIQEWM
ncbi:MAG TPA: hypothetical protein VGK23_05790 [Methanomassiliicoccales archaeon]|jgi:uncharacterized membrane protein YozB (DUF420 family)